MDLGHFTDVSGFGRLEWIVLGLHGVVGVLFLTAAGLTVASGGPLYGAGLQALIGLMVAALGLVVAQVARDR
ncbi:hypothetical protein ACFQE8_03540 [Salinirubellus sp. GCM10025818]|uniref:hypothetical protein n=1 Tax=Salinirubellus TaxID=2162630 RepID=UPI0030D0EB8A